MARRKDRPLQNAVGPARTEAAGPNAAQREKQFVVFRCANGAFAFPLGDISEVLRLPRLVHMPLAPRSLLGLGNWGGVVLPVVSLANLLGFPTPTPDNAARVIVTGGAAPIGFVVDRINSLMTVPADRVRSADAGAGSIDPVLLDGVVKGAEGDDTIKILNLERLLRDEFAHIGAPGSRGQMPVSMAGATKTSTPAERRQLVSFLSFVLQRQEYGIPLDRVREIVPLPAYISEVPRAETAVLGVVTLRDRLLPLVSLRALLGLPADVAPEQHGKVVVLSMGRGSVGVVADRTREILHVDANSIDPAPALLTRGAGDAEITSICRLDHGKRLVALLSPDRLFRSDLMSRVIADQTNDGGGVLETDGTAMAEEQFIIFRLGAQEYGLPIDAVREIVRPPENATKLPKAPAFINGVMNLRGSVIPIVDLRCRFELVAKEQATEQRSAQRILVLTLGSGQTGFMVDGVSEVLKVPSAKIRPAPDLSPEQMRLIGRVANLEHQGRMILLVDPHQLLDQVESDVLAKFDRANLDQALKAS
jgi:purine-binding chemotaxis protein CheW